MKRKRNPGEMSDAQFRAIKTRRDRERAERKARLKSAPKDKATRIDYDRAARTVTITRGAMPGYGCTQ